jgi:hypothetical protein
MNKKKKLKLFSITRVIPIKFISRIKLFENQLSMTAMANPRLFNVAFLRPLQTASFEKKQ